MALYAVTGTLDLTTKAKRLGAWQFKNTGTAATIDFKDGGSGGTTLLSVPLAVGSTNPTFAALDYARPLIFPSGVYIAVTGGTIVGSVDVP